MTVQSKAKHVLRRIMAVTLVLGMLLAAAPMAFSVVSVAESLTEEQAKTALLTAWERFGVGVPEDGASQSLSALTERAKKIVLTAADTAAQTAFWQALRQAQELSAEGRAFYALTDKLTDSTQAQRVVIAQPKSSYRFDGAAKSRTAVTADTKVTGLADASVLGNYYIDKAEFSTIGWSYVINLDMCISPVDLTAYDKLYMYVVMYKADGITPAPIKINVQGNDKDSKYYELRGWGTVAPKKVSGINRIKFVAEQALDGNTNYKYLSFGSLIGETTSGGGSAQLPENWRALSLQQLVDYVRGLDASVQSDVAAELAQAEALISARANLKSRWQHLGDLTTETWASFAANARPVDAAVAQQMGLTQTELGDYCGHIDNYTAQNGVGLLNTIPLDMSKYEYLTFYARGTGAGLSDYQAQLTLQFQKAGSSDWESLYLGLYSSWHKITISTDNLNAYMRQDGGATLASTVKISLFNPPRSGATIGVDFSSMVGYYYDSPALPEEIDTMTLEEFLFAARKLDTSMMTTDQQTQFFGAIATAAAAVGEQSVDEFVTEEKAALLNAWGNLQTTTYTVLGTPSIARQSIDTIPSSFGLTAEQKEQFGGYYTTTTGDGLTYNSDYMFCRFDDLSVYDYFTVSGYLSGNSTYTYSWGYDTGHNHWPLIANYKPVSTPGFFTHKYDSTNAEAAKLLNGTETISGLRISLNSGAGKLYIGSLLGWSLGTAMPEGAAYMGAEDLVNQAMRVDTSRCTSGVAEFERARTAAAQAVARAKEQMDVDDVTASCREPVVAAYEALQWSGKPALPAHYKVITPREFLSFVVTQDYSTCTDAAGLTALREQIELYREYADAYAVTADVTGSGTLTFSPETAAAGETVTVTVQPGSGCQLQAGSLQVVNAAGTVVALPLRQNFQSDDRQAVRYTFAMPDEAVTVQAAFAAKTAPVLNMGMLGHSTNMAKHGLRFVFRVYRTEQSGQMYVNIGGNNEKVTAMGAVVAQADIMKLDGITELTLEAAQRAGWQGYMNVDFLSEQNRHIRYDVCDDYEDISICLINLNDKTRQAADIAVRPYVRTASGLYYMPTDAVSFEDYAAELKYEGEQKYTTVTQLTRKPTRNNKVEFEVTVPDLTERTNLLSADQVDVELTLTAPSGKTTVTPGFAYQEFAVRENGQITNEQIQDTVFRLRVSPTELGRNNYVITVKREGVLKDTVRGFVDVAESDNHGFIRVAQNNRFLAYDDGTPYVPIGENVAWGWPVNPHSLNGQYIIDQVDSIADYGGTYMRLWNAPYFLYTFSGPTTLDFLDAQEFDRIFEQAEKRGVHICFTLFNHGQFQYQGADAAFDAGAFYKELMTLYGNDGTKAAAAFFTDATVKAQSKDWLRYMMARYGYSTSVLTWELFNEFDGTTGWSLDRSNGTTHVQNWHNEIGAYLHSNDPYRHLVSTSSANSYKEVLDVCGSREMDLFNHHVYNFGLNDQINRQESYYNTYQKPLMMAEVGYIGNGRYNGMALGYDMLELHQETWGGMMGGSCGGAAMWMWELTEAMNGFVAYSGARKMADLVPWTDPSLTHIANASVTDGNVRAVGYTANAGAYFLLFDKQWKNNNRTVPIRSGVRVTLSMNNGTYTVKWLDTWTGNVLQSGTATASGGSLTVLAPDFNRDVAMIITRN